MIAFKAIALSTIILLSSPTFASELLEVKQSANAQIVTLTGNINFYIDDDPKKYIDDTLSKLQPSKPISLVVNYSGGGSEVLFLRLMNGLLDKTKNVTMIIKGECSSACTYISPMAKETIAVTESAKIRVHRTFRDWGGTIWVNKVEDQAAEYGEFGANADWFLQNRHVFTKDNSLYQLSKRQSIESGLVDKYVGLNSLGQDL